MSVPMYAWIRAALVFARNLLWRVHDIRARTLRVVGCACVGVLTGAAVFAVAGAPVGAAFFTCWTATWVSVLDTAVVLALLAKSAQPPSVWVVAWAVVLAIASHAALLPVVGGGIPLESAVFALAGAALVVLGWRFFAAAEAAAGIRAGWWSRRVAALAAGAVLIVLFAWTSARAAAATTAPGFLALLAAMTALLGLRPLFLLAHGLLERGEWSRTGMAVLAAFIGTKLLFHAAFPGEISTSSGIAVLSVLVVAVVLAGCVGLPRLGPAGPARAGPPGSTEGGRDGSIPRAGPDPG